MGKIMQTKYGKGNYKALEPFITATDKNEGYGVFKSAGFMDLVMEKLWYEDIFGNPVYSICHYGKQNGDAMRDPEITFSIDKEQGRVMPLTFQNDYVGIYQEVFVKRDGQQLFSKRLLVELDDFLKMWVGNIKEQGFDPEKNEAE